MHRQLLDTSNLKRNRAVGKKKIKHVSVRHGCLLWGFGTFHTLCSRDWRRPRGLPQAQQTTTYQISGSRYKEPPGTRKVISHSLHDCITRLTDTVTSFLVYWIYFQSPFSLLPFVPLPPFLFPPLQCQVRNGRNQDRLCRDSSNSGLGGGRRRRL